MALRRICGSHIYGDKSRGGLEKRERGAPDFVPARGPASAWVRNRQAHRSALGRHAPFSCGLALPAAIPAGKTRLDPRAVGRESESKTTEVLPADCGRRARGRAATQEVARVCRSRGPSRGSATCLNGSVKSGNIWQEGILGRNGRRKSSKSFPIIFNKGTKSSVRRERGQKRPSEKCSRKSTGETSSQNSKPLRGPRSAVPWLRGQPRADTSFRILRKTCTLHCACCAK